jgi:hypothetical protein
MPIAARVPPRVFLDSGIDHAPDVRRKLQGILDRRGVHRRRARIRPARIESV